MKITLTRIILLSLSLMITSPPFAATHQAERALGLSRSVFHDPLQMIELFLQAVDRGELKVFEHTLDRSMIIPVRVEYQYELETGSSQVTVYSDLKQTLPVPGRDDCYLGGISATLDRHGTIIETLGHIWQH